MHEVPIQNIINEIAKRKDGDVSIEFLKIFEDMTKSYLAYKKWVEMMIKKNGNYHQRTDVIPKLVESLELIDDIVENGMKESVKFLEEKEGFEVDGHHRIAIMKALGHTTILCN